MIHTLSSHGGRCQGGPCVKFDSGPAHLRDFDHHVGDIGTYRAKEALENMQ
jgi:hypothetical protein